MSNKTIRATNNTNLYSEDAPYKFYKLFEIFGEALVLSEKRKIRVLDVGCGSGMISSLLKTYYENLGYEIKLYLNDIANKISDKVDGSFMSGDIRNIKIKSKFDIVLAVDIIEHVKNPDIYISRIAQISRFAIMKIPLEGAIFFRLRNYFSWGRYYRFFEDRVGHINFFTNSKIKKYLFCAPEVSVFKYYYMQSFSQLAHNEKTTLIGKIYFRIAAMTSAISAPLSALFFSDSVIYLISSSANSSGKKVGHRKPSNN